MNDKQIATLIPVVCIQPILGRSKVKHMFEVRISNGRNPVCFLSSLGRLRKSSCCNIELMEMLFVISFPLFVFCFLCVNFNEFYFVLFSRSSRVGRRFRMDFWGLALWKDLDKSRESTTYLFSSQFTELVCQSQRGNRVHILHWEIDRRTRANRYDRRLLETDRLK